jgi:hypothetical protein
MVRVHGGGDWHPVREGYEMTNYPLLDIFLTMLYFFLWMLWIFLVVRIILDIFADDEMNGWAKGAWVVFVIILPLFGVLAYLIARGGSMRERQQREQIAADQAFREQVRDAAGTSASPAVELSKLADLRQRGVLTDAEFAREKEKILS